MTTLGMGHAGGYVCELQSMYTKQILLDCDVILYEYYKIKWCDALSKIGGIKGKGANKL